MGFKSLVSLINNSMCVPRRCQLGEKWDWVRSAILRFLPRGPNEILVALEKLATPLCSVTCCMSTLKNFSSLECSLIKNVCFDYAFSHISATCIMIKPEKCRKYKKSVWLLTGLINSYFQSSIVLHMKSITSFFLHSNLQSLWMVEKSLIGLHSCFLLGYCACKWLG